MDSAFEGQWSAHIYDGRGHRPLAALLIAAARPVKLLAAGVMLVKALPLAVRVNEVGAELMLFVDVVRDRVAALTALVRPACAPASTTSRPCRRPATAGARSSRWRP